MKATIIYFSQSGNTQKIAKAMAKKLSDEDLQVVCLPFQKLNTQDLLEREVIGIGSPTFESHAPTPIKNFVKSLPQLKGKKAFVFATGGGAGGNVLYDLERLLRKKGLEVIDQFFSLGELRHPAPCILGSSAGRPNAEDLQNAQDFALNLSKQLKGISVQKYNGLKPKKGLYNFVGWITGSDALIRFLEPKPNVDSEKCKKCQKCVRECPMNAIQMSSYPQVNKNCIRCYRCANTCPNQSFKINWKFGNLVVFAFWNKLFMRLFGEYQKVK